MSGSAGASAIFKSSRASPYERVEKQGKKPLRLLVLESPIVLVKSKAFFGEVLRRTHL